MDACYRQQGAAGKPEGGRSQRESMPPEMDGKTIPRVKTAWRSSGPVPRQRARSRGPDFQNQVFQFQNAHVEDGTGSGSTVESEET